MANDICKLLRRVLSANFRRLYQLHSPLIRACLLNLIAQIALGTPVAAQAEGNSWRVLAHMNVRHTLTRTS